MPLPVRRGPFEADVAATLDLIRAAHRPRFDQMPLDEARAAYRAGKTTSQLPPIPLAEVFDLTLGGRPARLYRPDTTVTADAAPALLFLHGGGWVIGDLDTHDGICRRLAEASRRTVIALDYRLAPEHPLPAAYDDAEAAYAAMIGQAADLRIAPDDIAVAGDSAGAALAAMIAVHATAGDLPVPSAAALFYPVADLRADSPSYTAVAGVPLTGETMHWFLGHALPDGTAPLIARCSPLLAPSLAGFPPTFLTSAGHDPLCDEAFLFADRLRAAGVPVEHRHLPGQIHGYLTLGRLIGEAERSLAVAGAFLGSRSAS